MRVVYEDNHIIIVDKAVGEIVQGDRTGDRTLADDVKAYIKEHYAKPGEVFLGVVHRLDRPVAGLVIFARTSKALTRLNAMIRNGEIHKTYRALVCAPPPAQEETLEHYLLRNERLNKTFVVSPPESTKNAQLDAQLDAQGTRHKAQWAAVHSSPLTPHSSPRDKSKAKRAALTYRVLPSPYERYTLLEIDLHTGRHHQIRAQLAAIGCPIKGDLKYGAPRSNPDGGISLCAHRLRFEHPVSHKIIDLSRDGFSE